MSQKIVSENKSGCLTYGIFTLNNEQGSSKFDLVNNLFFVIQFY